MHMMIVGGGSAGWITANLLAKHLLPTGVTISLVESDEIKTIGVGEGSTPQLKSFMDDIGLSESDWLMKCNATYKNGIKFTGWSTKPGFEHYFHPFPAQVDDYTVPGFFHNSFLNRKGIDLPCHPDSFFLASKLAYQNQIPVPRENFPFEVNYGYHFDAHLFTQLLTNHAVSKGVKRIVGTIDSVACDAKGDIDTLALKSGEVLSADFFIDCSGGSALLIEKTLNATYKSFAKNLFNDSAVMINTPSTPNTIESYTHSTTMLNGWRWQIPLSNRIGNGYVYSSRFTNAKDAEAELRQALNLAQGQGVARHLKMRVGYFKQSWKHNCVAIGMSQGFIEPLEATALHLTIESVQRFIQVFIESSAMKLKQEKYNKDVEQRYEAIRDYIVAHYKLNSRRDSEYWRENAANPNISNSLASIINCWTGGHNLSDELANQNIDQYYPSVSWHCLLAGYGILPNQQDLVEGNAQANKYNIKDIQTFVTKCASHYPSQYSYLRKQAPAVQDNIMA